MNLEERIKAFGLEAKALNKLEAFRKILLEENKKMNLTSITEEDEVDVKHFLDCLSLFKTPYLNGKKKVIDIGSGAGFPGIVIKAYNEYLNITLLDSLNKRIRFLNKVIDELEFKEIEAIHGRAEELGRKADYRESYDLATSRAVANLATLCEYALPFVKAGGYFIAMKGPEYEKELEEAKNAIRLLGGRHVESIEVKLPMDITHYLLVIKKINNTDKKYPRSGGKPRSKPL